MLIHTNDPGVLDDFGPAISVVLAGLSAATIGARLFVIGATDTDVAPMASFGITAAACMSLATAGYFAYRATKLRNTREGELITRTELPWWIALPVGVIGYSALFRQVIIDASLAISSQALPSPLYLVGVVVVAVITTFLVGFRRSVRLVNQALYLNYGKVWTRQSRRVGANDFEDIAIQKSNNHFAVILTSKASEALTIATYKKRDDAESLKSRLTQSLRS